MLSASSESGTEASVVTDFPLPKIERYRHAMRTDRIVRVALVTLGWEISEFLDLLGYPPGATLEELRVERLSITEWAAICDALYLRIGSIDSGYSRTEHRARIREAMEGGYFHLSKKNGAVRALIQEIREERRRQLQYRATHLGLKLRWKVRLQEFRERVYRWYHPNPRGYDPLARISAAGRERRRLLQPDTPAQPGLKIAKRSEIAEIDSG
jgi:hypothetical protein